MPLILKYKIRLWKGDTKSLLDFYQLICKEYNFEKFDFDGFKHKHYHNPLGKSLISLAYDNDFNLVAGRAFWRLFHKGIPIYQPCDTITALEHRRNGLFSKLTNYCIDKCEHNAILINFPNNKSYPGYIKLGWKKLDDNRKKVTFRASYNCKLLRNHSELGDIIKSQHFSDYLNWRFIDNPSKNYKIYFKDENLIIFNGVQSGGISLSGDYNSRLALPGVSVGYDLSTRLKKFSLSNFYLSFKSQSKTVYFTKDSSNVKLLMDFVSSYQINTLMDTF